MTKYTFYILIAIGCMSQLLAQEKVTTFGIQLKPIIPVGFIGAGVQTKTSNNITYTHQPNMGMNFGMVIRKGINKSLSIETGLNFLKRNYDLIIADPNTSFSSQSDFSIVNYEIPALLLVYVRLGRKVFMNVAGGGSFDIFPSSLFVQDIAFSNAINRPSWISMSLLTNLGWEYRTEKNGYFYLGASLHRPFTSFFTEYITYKGAEGDRFEQESFKLSGSYFTVDLRYFFHEEKQEKRVKTKKINRKKAMRKIREAAQGK